VAFFANDTMNVGKFSFTPGFRYDSTNTNGSFSSPSLGITYKLNDKTILRGYAARGFSIPSLSSTFCSESLFAAPNPALRMEKVWSFQVGVESTALKYLWLKAGLFRYDISDALDTEVLSDGSFRIINKGRQRRQGLEFEVRTVPVYNISLLAGVAFIDAKDLENAPLGFFDLGAGKEIPDIPRYTYDIGVLYNDNKKFRASLRGHYILVDSVQEERNEMLAFMDKVNSRSKRFNAIVVLNLDCNLACAYCFEEGLKGSRYMSEETAGLLVRFIERRIEERLDVHIDFYGVDGADYRKQYLDAVLEPFILQDIEYGRKAEG
jgi:outer membrane receptor protein involved in Fe transport